MIVEPKILIIDDDENDRECYRRYLANYKNILEASTGEQGLIFCDSDSMPDCILLDYILPDTNGLKLLSQITNKIKNTNSQIIFMTGHGSEETAVNAMKNGADDYLIKTNLDKTTLQNTISKAIARKQEQIKKAQEEKEMFEKAFYDSLTGLYNKYSFYKSIDNLLETSKRYNRIFALLFIDLNKFKAINDNYNHHTGDRLLKQIANRLKESIRKEDIAARICGDEFAVALTEIRDYHNAGDIAQNILHNINKIITIDNHNFKMTASIGISVYPGDDCHTVQELINSADDAMYIAKHKKLNSCHYSIESLNKELHCYDKLKTAIIEELKNKKFTINLHAIYHLHDNTIFGYTPHTLWSSRFLNSINIDDIYDGINKIGLLTKFSYEMLCSYLTSINNILSNTSSKVNSPNLILKVYTCELIDIDFIKIFTDAMSHTTVNPHHIYLEIDSNVIFDHGDLGRNIIKKLLSLNVQIILNISSIGEKIINFIKENNELSIIKISDNLINQDNTQCNKIIIAAIVNTMQKLGIRTLLSNIDSQQKANFARLISTDLGHGEFFDSQNTPKTSTTAIANSTLISSQGMKVKFINGLQNYRKKH